MKNVFTLSLFALLTVFLSFAQGFEPPVGSVNVTVPRLRYEVLI